MGGGLRTCFQVGYDTGFGQLGVGAVLGGVGQDVDFDVGATPSFSISTAVGAVDGEAG
jgi:hypothetical protein